MPKKRCNAEEIIHKLRGPGPTGAPHRARALDALDGVAQTHRLWGFTRPSASHESRPTGNPKTIATAARSFTEGEWIDAV